MIFKFSHLYRLFIVSLSVLATILCLLLYRDQQMDNDLETTPTASASSTPEVTLAEYRNEDFSLDYDENQWEEGVFDGNGRPAMPSIRFGALIHRLDSNCAIAFKLGGWHGPEEGEWEFEKEDVILGEVHYHVWRHYLSPQGLIYIVYDPFQADTGEDYLPGGRDFWVSVGEPKDVCIHDVEEVLSTFKLVEKAE